MHILHELGKPKLDLVVSRESRIDSLVLQALATVQLRVCVILAPGIQKSIYPSVHLSIHPSI